MWRVDNGLVYSTKQKYGWNVNTLPATALSTLPTTVLFVLSTGNKVLVNSFVFQSCLIHTDLQDFPHFDSLTLSNIFLYNFLLVFWLATLALIFPAIYLVLAGWIEGLICFCIFKSSVLVFCRNFVFCFLSLSMMHI